GRQLRRGLAFFDVLPPGLLCPAHGRALPGLHPRRRVLRAVQRGLLPSPGGMSPERAGHHPEGAPPARLAAPRRGGHPTPFRPAGPAVPPADFPRRPGPPCRPGGARPLPPPRRPATTPVP